MGLLDIAVADMRLDGSNPRHDAVTGEREIIEALLAKEGSKITSIAGDIAAFGLSPIEVPMVLEAPGPTYVVIEGNRRLAALKLLSDPSLTARADYAARFEALRKKMSGAIVTVPCYIVATRDDAKHWQEVRHGGEQGGRGIVPWDADASNRFFGGTGTQVAKALVLIDALKKAYPINAAIQADLDRIRKGRPSTLGRLISDPDVRARLGIVLKGNAVTAHYSSADLQAAMAKIASDFAGTATVSTVDSKPLRDDYLRDISAFLPDLARRQAHASPLTPITKASPPPPTSPTPTPTPTPTPALTPTHTPTPPLKPPSQPLPLPLFGGVAFTKLGSRLPLILSEVQRLNLDLFPNAAAVLMRAVVELAVTQVHSLNGWPLQAPDSKGNLRDIPLKKLIEKCVNTLDPTLKDKRYQPVRIGLNDPNSPFSISNLHAWVHNPYYHPAANTLRSVAASYSEFLSGLDSLVP